MITVNSVSERREAVTAVNDYDTRTGGLKSQRAKYEKPLWWFILAILNGKDSVTGHTTVDIRLELMSHNLHYSQPAIDRCLKIMTNLDYSIQPQRRNCGISCYDAVTTLGDLHCQGNYARVYRLGVTKSEAAYHRKSHNIIL